MIGPTGNETKPDVAPRSRLFHLEPRVDKYGVESLTSYIGRLARKHFISMSCMIHDVLIPLLDKTYLSSIRHGGGTKFLAQSGSLNGIGDGATTLVQTIQKLTCRSDLTSLTLLPFQHLINNRRLIKHRRAWCPTCLEEMRDSQTDIYEPLVWSLQVIQVCPLHEQHLEQLCPHCKKTVFWWERYSIPGYCKCGGYLGVQTPFTAQSNVNEFKRQIYYTSAMNTLLYLAFENAELIKQISVQQYIQYLTSTMSMNRAELSRYLNIPKNSLHGWYHESNRIPLDILLDICYPIRHKPVSAYSSTRKSHSQQYSSNSKIRSRMQASLSQLPPPSLTTLASELQVDRRLLSRKFPKLSHQIILRYQYSIIQNHEQRLSRIALDIRRAVLAVKREGKNPTQRNVEEYLGKPGLLRERCLKDIWLEECIIPRVSLNFKEEISTQKLHLE